MSANSNPFELAIFVRRLLGTIAKRERFVSYELKHEAGSKPGDGFMGIMVAVEIRGPRMEANTGAISEDTLSLICKLMPDSVERQEMFHTKTMFAREVNVYNTILPMLAQFQREKGLTERTGFFGYPQCYAAVADPVTNEFAIIMRNLRTCGYDLWDKFAPMPFDNAKLLFEQLGRMNGVSLAIRDQRADLFAEIENLDDMFSRLLKTGDMQKICQTSFEKSVGLVEDPEHRRVTQYVLDNWPSMIMESALANDSYAGLSHGDSWNNNMMFLGKDKICLLDWQNCRHASPALDIAYFLCSSTDKALRQQFDKLIGIYHQNLVDVVRVCGSDPEKLMPFAELQKQMKVRGRFGVAMAPLLLQIIVSDADNVIDVDKMALEMSKTVGNKTEMEFAKFNPASLTTYRQRLGDVIDDAKAFGWI